MDVNESFHPFSEHIKHIRKVAGIDHIGIGADFDGVNKWALLIIHYYAHLL